MNGKSNWRGAVAASVLALVSLAPAEAAQGIKLPAYQQVQLSNGATLLLMEKRDVPLVSFSAALRGGRVTEPADKNGVASLAAALLQKGAGERDANAFADAVDAVGGVFDVEAELEFLSLSGEFLSQDMNLMLGLLADVLRRPRLDPFEFDKLRTRQIQSLAAMKDSDPRALIGTYADAFVFGDHPYARSAFGSESSLENVNYEDVKKYLEANLSPGRLLLVVAGDFNAQDMRARLERALEGWASAAPDLPTVEPAEPVPGGRVLLVDKPGATQTYFWIGNVGVRRDDPDAVAIDLVNTLFGGRFTSMLNSALRIESGLTYGARSRIDENSQPGTVAMVSYTATESTTEAVNMALDQLKKLHQEGLDQTQLQSGKTYRQGLFPMGFETARMLASQLMNLKFYGLPDSSVNDYSAQMAAVSMDKSREVISRVYPSTDELVFVFIGNSELIGEQLEAYGKLTRMSITDSDWSAPRP